MRAWEAGVIPALLKEDNLSYREALRIAETWGCCLFEDRVDNLITNAGLYLIGDILTGDQTTGFAYHAIGTGTTQPVVGDTTLDTEVARKLLTSIDRAGATLTLSVFYLASECTYYIREAGIVGGDNATATADTGDLFSHYLQTYNNSGGTVDLSWDYDLDLAEG